MGEWVKDRISAVNSQPPSTLAPHPLRRSPTPAPCRVYARTDRAPLHSSSGLPATTALWAIIFTPGRRTCFWHCQNIRRQHPPCWQFWVRWCRTKQHDYVCENILRADQARCQLRERKMKKKKPENLENCGEVQIRQSASGGSRRSSPPGTSESTRTSQVNPLRQKLKEVQRDHRSSRTGILESTINIFTYPSSNRLSGVGFFSVLSTICIGFIVVSLLLRPP